MRKMTPIVLLYAVFMWVLPTSAQRPNQQPNQQAQGQPAGPKLEAMLNAAQMPFTKTQDGAYVAVITVEQNESERFHIALNYMGNDPKDSRLQVVEMYFLLAQIPKNASFPPALIKQINQWNGNLTMGKVIAVDNLILLTSSTWLSKMDAEVLELDATIGHYSSQDIRKEIAPYLKQ